MASNARFLDRHVLVTGAGSGIGRAIALRLAREGARVTIVGRRRARLEETAHALSVSGGSPACVQVADVRDPAALRSAFAAACTQHGALFACVANSGLGGPNQPGAEDRFEELVATNLVGTYHTLRAAEEALAAGTDPRHLVVIASILARLGVAGYTGYCASKAGLLGLVRALAVELAPKNVQVNAVLPGWVETDMAREGLAGMAKAIGTDVAGAKEIALQAVPLRRFGEPEDVAGLVAWLLSPDARGVTGASLDMNNGALMS